MNLENLGKALLAFAAVMACVGGLLYFMGKGLHWQQLPGDIKLERDGFSCFLPIVTSLVISVVLTILVNLIRYFRR